MLNTIRTHAANPFIKGLLGTVVFVFIFYFGWSMKGSSNDPGATPTAVVTVNDKPITAAEIARTYDGMVKFYENILKQPINQKMAEQFGLKDRAIDMLVDRKLLLAEAERQGLGVSDNELDDAIRAQPMFAKDGRYSKDLFIQVLASNNISVDDYRADKRLELLMNKVEEKIKSTATVTEEDINNEYLKVNSKITAEYVEFDPENFKAMVPVGDAKLEGFLKTEGESFRTSEKRMAKYVFFPVEKYFGQVNITNEELQKEYNARAFKFQDVEEVSARHILFKVDSGASEATWDLARVKAENARGKVLSRSAFMEFAKNFSDDTASKPTGGDLGSFAKGTMVPEFEQAAFSLKEGEVSQPVRTAFGYHLIMVEKHSAPRQKSFEEAKNLLTQELLREKARALANKAADNVLMDIEDKKATIDTLPGGLKAESTAMVEATQAHPTIPANPAFVKTLFDIRDLNAGKLLDSPLGTYLIMLSGRQESRIPTIAEIKDQVKARYQLVEAGHLAKEAAERFAKTSVESGWAAALSSSGKSAKTTDSMTDGGSSIPPVGNSEEAKEAIFTNATLGKSVPGAFEINDKFYVFKISALSQPGLSGVAAEHDKLRDSLMSKKREKALKDELEILRSKAKIVGLENVKTKD